MIWQVPHIWEQEDVWIIGGGPSVATQFGIPNKVIQAVVAGSSPPSVYSPYMSFLFDKHVIGVNVAFLLGDWIDMLFFGDNSFFLERQKSIALFPGIKVSCSPITSPYDWIKYLPRDSHRPRGITPNPKMVSWNGNSGSAAISIAANAGAKRIFLLGFDMKLDETNHQHWHDLYHRYGVPLRHKTSSLPFDRHLRGFPEIARDAKQRGIEIINVSPDSAITNFRKVTLKELQ